MTQVEQFDGSEMHLHVTGSIAAALVPWWVHWLRSSDGELVVNASVTPAATRFMSVLALERLVNGRVWVDAWEGGAPPEDAASGRSGGSECFIVFPATLDTVMRLAQARADSPALMMLQVTGLPIVIADTFPGSNPVVERYLRLLELRPNVAFAPRVEGVRADDRSATTLGFNLPGAIATANTMLRGEHP